MLWFICCDGVEYLLPQSLHSIKTFKAHLLFSSQRKWYLQLSDLWEFSLSFSLCLCSWLTLLSVISFCYNPGTYANKGKKTSPRLSLNVPCLAVPSPSCRLDWFHPACDMAFCHDQNQRIILHVTNWVCLDATCGCEVWRPAVCRNKQSKFKLLRCTSYGMMESPGSSREPTHRWPWCSSAAWPLAAASCVPPLQAQGKWGGPPCPFGPC